MTLVSSPQRPSRLTVALHKHSPYPTDFTRGLDGLRFARCATRFSLQIRMATITASEAGALLAFAGGAGVDNARHFHLAQGTIEDRDFVDQPVEDVFSTIPFAKADR